MLLQNYTEDWKINFKLLESEISKPLLGLDVVMEHVGSTAVHNLASKPIIDIDIVYKAQTDFEKIKTALISIGYYHNGNQGIEDREVFKRSGLSENNILDNIRHHLYVCSHQSKALERHLLFRDYLRNNEWAREKYQSIKYNIAEKAQQNQKIYAQLKEDEANDFIDEVVALRKQEIHFRQ